jgi:hypothetical protein
VFRVSVGQLPDAGRHSSGLVGPEGEVVFVLGPPRVLGGVFGLGDEEYGWPYPVQASDVKTASDRMLGHRCHPPTAW